MFPQLVGDFFLAKWKSPVVSIIARVEDKTSGSDRKLDLKMFFLEYSSICFKSLLVILYNTPSSGKISCLSSQGKKDNIVDRNNHWIYCWNCFSEFLSACAREWGGGWRAMFHWFNKPIIFMFFIGVSGVWKTKKSPKTESENTIQYNVNDWLSVKWWWGGGRREFWRW